MHGGLSPDIKTLDQIRAVERCREIPHQGAFCGRAVMLCVFNISAKCVHSSLCIDLVWSDPEDIETWAVSPRGAGWLFGSKVTTQVDGRDSCAG